MLNVSANSHDIYRYSSTSFSWQILSNDVSSHLFSDDCLSYFNIVDIVVDSKMALFILSLFFFLTYLVAY